MATVGGARLGHFSPSDSREVATAVVLFGFAICTAMELFATLRHHIIFTCGIMYYKVPLRNMVDLIYRGRRKWKKEGTQASHILRI